MPGPQMMASSSQVATALVTRAIVSSLVPTGVLSFAHLLCSHELEGLIAWLVKTANAIFTHLYIQNSGSGQTFCIGTADHKVPSLHRRQYQPMYDSCWKTRLQSCCSSRHPCNNRTRPGEPCRQPTACPNIAGLCSHIVSLLQHTTRVLQNQGPCSCELQSRCAPKQLGLLLTAYHAVRKPAGIHQCDIPERTLTAAQGCTLHPAPQTRFASSIGRAYPRAAQAACWPAKLHQNHSSSHANHQNQPVCEGMTEHQKQWDESRVEHHASPFQPI